MTFNINLQGKRKKKTTLISWDESFEKPLVIGNPHTLGIEILPLQPQLDLYCRRTVFETMNEGDIFSYVRICMDGWM